MLQLKVLSVIALCLFECIGTGWILAEEQHQNPVARIMERAKEKAKEISLPVNPHAEAGQKAAEQSAELFYSSTYQERIQQEQQRLKKELETHTASWTRKADEKEEQQSRQDSAEKYYLFISSSIPDATVHTYIEQLTAMQEKHIIPVMRGLVGGLENLDATITYFRKILQEDPSCQDSRKYFCRRYQLAIEIRPSLFEHYGISKVPALVYDNGRQTLSISGDAGLTYLMERLEREVGLLALNSATQNMREEQ